MSTRIPTIDGRQRPTNLAVAMRETFVALNELVLARLAAHGHAVVRSAHSAVFQYLDDTGTTVSRLAERAQMTKQAMAELVLYLEQRGYVERVPDPSDRRAKLVRATPRGEQLYAIAREVVAEIEADWTERLGEAKMRRLRELLEELNAGL